MTRDELKTFLSPLPDEAILSLTLFGEARGEPIEGIVGVGCVIRHRSQDAKRRWPQTLRQVCLQKSQFSCWMEAGGQENHEAVLAAAQTLLLRESLMPQLAQCGWVALGIMSGELLDNVKQANHYHSVQLKPRPNWAQPHSPVMQKGLHVFYKL